MQGKEVLTIKDVAALLKVGEKTIYSMAQGGELPAFKVRGAMEDLAKGPRCLDGATEAFNPGF